MFKVKQYFFICLMLLYSNFINAQASTSEKSLFIGSPNISIPLFDIHSGDISIPIFLKYNSSGIKVEEEASNVGLGWTLFTGGEIRRIVRGVPDDYYMNDLNNMGVGWIHELNQTETWVKSLFGWTIWSSTIFTFQSTPASYVDKLTPDIYTPSGMFKGFNIIRNYWLDTQPDIFTFSIPGNSGRFYFNKDGIVTTELNSNLKFSYTLSTDKRIDKFTVIDENGIQYVFSEKDTKKISYSGKDTYNLSYGQLGVPFKASSLTTTFTEGWHLYKVISASGKTIDYIYENDVNIIYPTIPTSKQCSDIEEKPDFNSISEVLITKRIRKITSNDFEVVFNKGARRTDLIYVPYSFSSYPISEIKYYWKNSSYDFKGYSLNQSYFLSDNCNSASYCTRLRLNSITEFGLNCSKPDITFIYNEQEKLPSRRSTEQDLWGYYNANGSTSLIPRIFIYPNLAHDKYRVIMKPNQNFYIETSGVNRQPDINIVNGNIETVMDAFILQQINLSEGGSIKYEYEPHEYLCENDLYRGGGLRIKKIITDNNDGNPNNDIVKEFSYKDQNGISSGRLVDIPIYAYLFYTKNDANSLGRVDDMYNNHIQDYYNMYTKITSYPSNFLIDQPISYSYVEVKQNNLGKTRYTFSNNYLFEDFNATFKTKVVHNVVACWMPEYSDICESGEPCCYFKEAPESIPDQDTYPFPSNESYSWDRGQITKIEEFNSNDKPVKSIDYTWSDSNQPEYIIALKDDHFFHIWYDRYCVKRSWPFEFLGDICPISTGSGNPQYVYGRYKIATGVSKKLTSVVEKTYNLNDDTKYSTLSKNYYYTSNNLLSSISQKQSDGSVIETSYRYPSDYNPIINFLCPKAEDRMTIALEKMVGKNVLNTPVETITTKDGKILDCKLNTFRYDYDNSIILPDNQYEIYLQTPLAGEDYTPSYIERESILLNIITCDKQFHFDSRFKPLVTFDSYDSQGNLLQFHPTNGINTSYIWGYSKTQPIAEVKNAKSDEIYFNGYEEGLNLYNYDARSGKSCAMINTTNQFAGCNIFNKSNLTSGKYIYSAWFKTSGTAALIVKDKIDQVPWMSASINNTNGVWKYYELVVDINSIDFTGCTEVAVEIWNPNSTPVYVDDVRFRPLNSQMTTYTYDPLIGITSVTGSNNQIIYNEYDCIGRFITSKDESGNILSHNEYNYSTLAVTTPSRVSSVNPQSYVLNSLPMGNNIYSFFISGEDFYCDNYAYVWNFGDGNTISSTTCFLDHKFPLDSNSSYPVTVNIFRGSELINTLTTTCKCIGSCVLTATQNGIYSFNFNISGTGFINSDFTYEWDFGDGTVISNSLCSMSHNFPNTTIENIVSVKILYNGNPIKIITTTCNITDSLLLGATMLDPCEFGFNITGSNFNPSDYTYNWNFGDGNTQLGSADSFCSYSFSTTGLYTVTVNVMYGGVVVKTLTVSASCLIGHIIDPDLLIEQ